MAYEDFRPAPAGDYVEVDPNADITIAGANEINIVTMNRQVSAYVSRDMGAGHFGVFEHEHDVFYQGASADSSYAACWGISNGLNDVNNWTYGICVFIWRQTGAPSLMLYEKNGAGVIDDSIQLQGITRYYCVTDRDATPIVTTIIYNEPGHLTIKDTIFGACAATTCRYVYGMASYNTGTLAKSISYNVYNLDLNEGVDVSSGIKIWDGSAYVELSRDDASPVKLYTGVETIGIELVAVGHADASPIRFFDGATTKAFKKKV